MFQLALRGLRLCAPEGAFRLSSLARPRGVLRLADGLVAHHGLQQARGALNHSGRSGEIDLELGHPFDRETVYWPTESSGFQLTSEHHGPTEGGYFYASNSFAAPEHGGTHLDAPIHFAEGKATTDQIPLARLIAPCVVVDISVRARSNPDALLEVSDLEGV